MTRTRLRKKLLEALQGVAGLEVTDDVFAQIGSESAGVRIFIGEDEPDDESYLGEGTGWVQTTIIVSLATESLESYEQALLQIRQRILDLEGKWSYGGTDRPEISSNRVILGDLTFTYQDRQQVASDE